jgi:hypothetical protein
MAEDCGENNINIFRLTLKANNGSMERGMEEGKKILRILCNYMERLLSGLGPALRAFVGNSFLVALKS